MSNKFLIKFVLSVLLLSVLVIYPRGVFAAAVTINNFNLSPNVVPTTTGGSTRFQMTLRLTINVAEFSSSCGSNNNDLDWYVYAGAGIKKASGSTTINRTSSSLSLNLDQTINVSISAPELRGGAFDYYAMVYCPKTGLDTKLVESGKVKITFGTGSTTDKVWACIAANNKYACSPANLNNLSDVPACSGRTPIQIGKNLCGQDSGSGPGPAPGSGGCGTPGQPACQSGETQTYPFEITNPLKGGANDFTSLVKILAQWIFNLAIPIAVAMIVYSGILFLTAAGEPAKVTKARDVLKYAVIGLAIILIGSGFVTLIRSILELGGTGTTQDQNSGLPVEQQLPTSGVVGNKCSRDRDCVSGLKCSNSICQRLTGNQVGEWCVGGVSCAQGLACDKTSDNVQVIDGQTLGKCYQP